MGHESAVPSRAIATGVAAGQGYRIELTAAQIDQLDNLTPAAGTHHNKEPMRMIDR